MYVDTEDNMHLTDKERRAMDINELKKLNHQASWTSYLQSYHLHGLNFGNTQHLDVESLKLYDYNLPEIEVIGIYESNQKVQGLYVRYKSFISFEKEIKLEF